MTDKPAKPTRSPKPLSPLIEAFCSEYARQPVNAKNITAAFRASRDTKGSKSATVAANARKLFQNPRVKARIAEIEAANPPPIEVSPPPDSPSVLAQGDIEFSLHYALTQDEMASLYQAYPETRTLSRSTCHWRAWRLMQDPAILGQIREFKEQIAATAKEKAGATIERTLLELTRIAYSNPEDFLDRTPDGGARVNLNKAGRDMMAAITEIAYDARGQLKVKFADKSGALDKLLKALGGYAKDNTQKGRAVGEAVGESIAKVMSPFEVARYFAFKLEEAALMTEAGKTEEPK